MIRRDKHRRGVAIVIVLTMIAVALAVSYAMIRTQTTTTQVQAIESLISAGAKGFLITPSDSKAIVPSIDKARQQGLLVIALDTPTDPANAVDATFATDNYQAGRLIGQWAKAQLNGKNPKIAMLDLNVDQVSVDVQRDQGFLQGMGYDIGDKAKIGASIGDFQSRLLLTVFYFTVALPFGILTRLVIDPLRLRHRPTTSGWTARQPIDSDLASARRQF